MQRSIVEEQRTDLELVQSILERDESALCEVIRLYGGQVKSMCTRICCDELEASSVVSDIFWELWRNASQYDWQRGSLRTYLLTMARSRSVDRYRSGTSIQKQQRKYLESESNRYANGNGVESPAELPFKAETASEVRTALDQLPQLQRDAMILAFYDGLSHRQVSEKLDIPLGSAKTLIRNGLIALRHSLARTNELRGKS